MNPKLKTWAGLAVLMIVGHLQMAGDLLAVPELRALGLATGASPAPKVFTSQNGFETFSSRFFIQWTDADGKARQMQLTPQTYARLKGPYNRRNAYGATFSYAPVFHASEVTRPMFESAAGYALCGEGTILDELGITPDRSKGPVTFIIRPRQPGINSDADGQTWKLRYDFSC